MRRVFHFRRLVCEMLEDRVLLSVATTPSVTLTGLSSPWALAFDSGGNLYRGQ